MVDMSGPGSRRWNCFSVGLSDLCNVDGFDNAAEENVIYGLQFNSGIYTRSVIAPPSRSQEGETNFEELVNANDAKINVHYSLVKNIDGIWNLIESPNWLIDITITPMSVMPGKSNRLKKIMNRGSALISYESSKKNGVLITEMNDSYYLAQNTETNVPVFLGLIAAFPDQKFKVNKTSSTTVIEVFLLDSTDEFVEIVPGLSLKWTREAAHKVCGILLENGNPMPSIRGVEFEALSVIHLRKILFSNKLHFRKLLYVERNISRNYLISIMP